MGPSCYRNSTCDPGPDRQVNETHPFEKTNTKRSQNTYCTHWDNCTPESLKELLKQRVLKNPRLTTTTILVEKWILCFFLHIIQVKLMPYLKEHSPYGPKTIYLLFHVGAISVQMSRLCLGGNLLYEN
jgi:hypothetical protein